MSLFSTPHICPFLIMFMTSYPSKVRQALSKEKKPIPGLTNRLPVDCGVVNSQPAFQHHFFQVAVAERVAQVPRTHRRMISASKWRHLNRFCCFFNRSRAYHFTAFLQQNPFAFLCSFKSFCNTTMFCEESIQKLPAIQMRKVV